MKPSILVVDDDAVIRDVLHIYLRNEGFEVTEAEDGLKAVALLKVRRTRAARTASCLVPDLFWPSRKISLICIMATSG
ncbi:UNVERIFIED_CONTAM: CheY-like chemotaxis protein [Brevibacillus sp. OAP136]